AFLMTTDVPEIYMQEFWATAKLKQTPPKAAVRQPNEQPYAARQPNEHPYAARQPKPNTPATRQPKPNTPAASAASEQTPPSAVFRQPPLPPLAAAPTNTPHFIFKRKKKEYRGSGVDGVSAVVETITTVNQRMSIEEIERVVAQRVANAIEAIAIYETKTNLARMLISQTERQEEEVADNASNKRKWGSNHNESLSQQNKGHKVPGAYTAWPINKKAHAGSLPLCNQCKFYHSGPCTVKCGNYKSQAPGYVVDSDPKKDEKDPKEDPADYPTDRRNNDDDESSNNEDDDDDIEKDEEEKEE
nr:hypothetical protein [Tanacetum cinerariifolium]